MKLPSLRHTVNSIFADFDNDGHLDYYDYAAHNLLINNGNGSFTSAGDLLPGIPSTMTKGAVWGDFDGDGFVDLYVGGYEDWPSVSYPDRIFHNDGGTGFSSAWIQTSGHRARGITSADFDEDGDLDVYVSNYRLQIPDPLKDE